jgi:rhodanese-related sulfurtransferase
MTRQSLHRGLAGAAVVAAALAVWVGEPVAKPAPTGADELSAIELAQWIHDRRDGLRVVDVRPPADFAVDHLPGSENAPALGVDPAAFAATDSTVLYGWSDEAARSIQERLRTSGRHALVLRGGYDAWTREVLSPEIPAGAADREPYRTIAALSRYFGGRPRVGPAAQTSSWRGC